VVEEEDGGRLGGLLVNCKVGALLAMAESSW
jgi:hypothetical protein